jgi:hypothetical protein
VRLQEKLNNLCNWKFNRNSELKFNWFFQFCDVVGQYSGDHPQEELLKFGHRSERKVELKKESCYIFATCWNMVISEYFSSEFGSDNFTLGPPAQATPLIYLVAIFRHFAIDKL